MSTNELNNATTILSWWALALDLIKVGLATFAGAWSAFQIERKYKEYQEKIRNFRSGKRAQFVLISQYQSLLAAQKQHLDAKEKDDKRFITLLPFGHFSQYQKIEIETLLFMLDEKEPNLLNELSVANEKFQTALGVLETRNNEHLSFQQRASKIGTEKALDKSTKAILKDLTDSLYETFEDSMKTNSDLLEKLSNFLKTYYKKGKQLKYYLNSK